MELKVAEQAGSQAVIKAEGRLDANSAEALKAKLKNIVAGGLTRLVIDMSAVSFVDSSGLSALVAGFRMVREQNGTLILAQPGPQIKVALELTRLNRVFPIHPDVASALASMNKP